TLVARGIQRKGWRVALDAFLRLRDETSATRMHLLLCGDGPEASRYESLHRADPDITFLGYQSRIHGLYRISDCAILPTRYAGESYPLCLIQAMQVGTPVIATRIGEIEGMVCKADRQAGILLDAERDSGRFSLMLKDAMASMLDASRRKGFARDAQVIGDGYDIDRMAENYFQIYMQMLEDPASAKGSAL
ncbi:MAG: glycosyltransferase family 4 protein, partial [Gammaproteobacteria bacterium]|nr:glycosyltransferase family 4 protein [Gammaproteobacteria bacterium]